MHEFYKYIETKYDNSSDLLFTDSDSLVYEMVWDGIYEDFYENKNLFDFSDYFEDSTFCDPANKNVIGKTKDEVKGKIIGEFVGIKSNMYSLVIVNIEEIRKARGVNKIVVKNIRDKEYIEVLFNKNLLRHKVKRIQSKLHRIGTYDVCEISLTCFDDKRYILDDSINTLPIFIKM